MFQVEFQKFKFLGKLFQQCKIQLFCNLSTFNVSIFLFFHFFFIFRPARSETKWKVYCRYISFSVHSYQWTLRFRSCGTRLLFEMELGSKFHIIDLCKGFELSSKIFCCFFNFCMNFILCYINMKIEILPKKVLKVAKWSRFLPF